MKKLVLITALLFTFFLVPETKAQIGTLDPTFGDNGVVSSDYSIGDRGWAVVIVGDTLIVGGKSEGTDSNSREARIIRYDTTGAEINTVVYNKPGPAGCIGDPIPEEFLTLAPGPGGTVYAGGYVQNGCTGLKDRDFLLTQVGQSEGSILVFDSPDLYNNFDNLRSAVLRPDGSLVGVGLAASTQNNQTYDIAATAYQGDGSIDSAFATAGSFLLDVGGAYDVGTDAALQSDGKLIVAGSSVSAAGDRDLLVIRLDTDGSLDNTFGSGGVVLRDVGGLDDDARGVALQPDGKILVVGTAYTTADRSLGDFVVARFNEDGSDDVAFGDSGIANLDFGDQLGVGRNVALLSNGKIMLVGDVQMGTELADRDIVVARLTSVGELDEGFDEDGFNTFDGTGGRDTGTDIAIRKNGKVVVSGFSDNAGDSDFTVLQFVGDPVDVVLALEVIPNTLTLTEEGRDVRIDWATGSEDGVSHFELEHGLNGTDFATTGHVEALNDVSGSRYTFVFKDLGVRTNYFRISQVNLDGTVDRTEVLRHDFEIDGPDVYPTFTEDVVRIDFPGSQRGVEKNVEVFNALGQRVLSLSTSHSSSVVDITELTRGAFFLRIQSGLSTTTHRIVKR